ncbi:MAG TPA: hypothetical protein VG318_16885, partial [Actinomycetota bacterium]|nr:hypothetical protein [Actinomycetota bacterium]
MKKSMVIVLGAFVVAAALPGTGAGAAPAPSMASSTGEDASTNKADNAIIVRGDMGVAVPPRGATAMMELAREDGTFDVLRVEHRRDGEVRTTYRPGDQSPEPIDESYDSALLEGTTIPACSDSAYNLYPSQVASQPYFLVNDDVLSETVTSAAMMKQAMLNGGSNIVNARNDCGLPDNVDAPALSGVGDTSLRSQFYVANGDHHCTDYDVWSVVELGTLYGAFASACIMWWDNGDILSADVRFNRDKNWFIGSPPS